MLSFGVGIKAAGSLSLLISLPTVAVGLVRYARQELFQDKAVVRGIIAPMALGSILGAVLGGLFVGLISAELLKLGLGAVLIWSAWKTLRHHVPARPLQAQHMTDQKGFSRILRAAGRWARSRTAGGSWRR